MFKGKLVAYNVFQCRQNYSFHFTIKAESSGHSKLFLLSSTVYTIIELQIESATID